MPSFDMLPPEDLNAVTDYVLALTHRGELEALLADAVEFEGELNEGAVPGMVETIQGQWKEALANVVNPRTPMPLLTKADAEAKALLAATKAKADGILDAAIKDQIAAQAAVDLLKAEKARLDADVAAANTKLTEIRAAIAAVVGK